MALSLSSSAFAHEAQIPQLYTCDGEDRSPPLAWSGAPERTVSYALIADDPDAPSGTFVHWVAFNIPATEQHLPEGVAHRGDMTEGMLQGQNDFGRIGYGGPCPPPGKPHRYRFKLYALDTKLNLQPGASKADVERAMEGHILEQTLLVGSYGRTR